MKGVRENGTGPAIPFKFANGPPLTFGPRYVSIFVGRFCRSEKNLGLFQMADYEDLQAQIAELRSQLGGAKPKPAPKKKAPAPSEEDVVYESPRAVPRAPKPTPAPRSRAPKATHPSELDERIASPRFDASIRLREPRLPVRATVSHKCNCPDCPHKS